MPEIVRADPRHRFFTLAAVVLVLALGAAMVVLGGPRIEDWMSAYGSRIESMSREELLRDYRMFSLLVSLGMFVPLSLTGCGFLYQGFKVRRAARYPYPGMWLLRDTALESGAAAERRARRFLMFGCALLVLAVAIAWMMYAVLMRLAAAM